MEQIRNDIIDENPIVSCEAVYGRHGWIRQLEPHVLQKWQLVGGSNKRIDLNAALRRDCGDYHLILCSQSSINPW